MKNTLLVLLSLIMIVFSTSAFTEEVGVIVERDGRWYELFTSTLANGQYETYHENGQLRTRATTKDGKLNGLIESYFDNGQLKSRGTYKDGIRHGLFEFYYDNGQLEARATIKRGRQEGLYVRYNKDGTLESKCFYVNGKKYECE